jgi:hypothetical protein
VKIVLLYGAPAVGKLTVARELGRITKLKVFHNHLTIDVARAIFDFGSPPFSRLLHRLRLDVIEEAAVQNVDLAITVTYHHSESMEAYAKASLQESEAFGARICLVHLTCTQEALEERVTGADRVAMDKLHSVEALNIFMRDKDYESGLPAPETLRIDNTHLAPDVVARQIAAHYALATS